MTGLDEGAHAVRHATAVLAPTHLALLEVRGAGAFEALNRLLPCDLFVHDGQARRTVLLDEQAGVIADVVVAKLDGVFLLFVDGLDCADAVGLLEEETPSGLEVTARDLSDEYELVSLHGPFAWELGALWLGQALISLPPLALYRSRLGVVLRSGRTGEFGYETLLPRASSAVARERLRDLGIAFDLQSASLATLDRCALENGGFVPRNVQLAGLSPVELQLQWRTSSKKAFRGRPALERRRTAAKKRVAWFNAPTVVAAGSKVFEDGVAHGDVVACSVSTTDPTRFVGQVLLDRGISHPGLRFKTDSGLELFTASPPLVEATSQRVRVQIDRYATRDRSRFPEPRGT